MNHKLEEALEACLKSMQAGQSVDECLNRFPDLAPDLRDLLKTADVIKRLHPDTIPEEGRIRCRQALLTKAEALAGEDRHIISGRLAGRIVSPVRSFFQSIRAVNPIMSKFTVALGIALIFVIFSGGLLISSAKSLPGDSLYPVKLAVENIRVHLAPNGEMRQEYEVNYNQQRVEEVQRLLGLERQQKISFEGTIISIDGSEWIVSGILVDVEAKTIIVAAPGNIMRAEPGMTVEIEGITNTQGYVTADEIHIREYHFIGKVEKINTSSWEISGISLNITSSTHIESGIQVGDEVAVLVSSQDNGLYALAILRNAQPATSSSTQQAPHRLPQEELLSEQDTEEYQIDGGLDNIGSKYWTVDGEEIYIVGETHIAGEIEVGDEVSVKYRIEENGSYTAIEIDKVEPHGQYESQELQETPQPAKEEVTQNPQTAPPHESEETQISTQNPEHEETPEPTGSYLGPE